MIRFINMLILSTLFLVSQSSFSQGTQAKYKWEKKPNVAQYKGADWKNEVIRISGISLEKAFEVAKSDNRITYFVYMKSNMYLEGKSGSDGYTAKGAFRARDVVFFSGKPWFGSSQMADSYVRVEQKAIEETKVVSTNPIKLVSFLPKGNILFYKGSVRVVENTKGVIGQLTQILNKDTEFKIELVGHTAGVTDESNNNELSLDRARFIQNLLINSGVASNRITIIGMGFTQSIADNSTETSRGKNRRVTFKITKRGYEYKNIEHSNTVESAVNYQKLNSEFKEKGRYLIHNVSIAGKGNSYKGKPGETVQVSMEVFHNCDLCGGSINQIIVGLGGEEKAQACVWNGGSFSAGWEIVHFEIKLPTTPGVYYLRSRYAQAYNCEKSLGWWKVDRSNGPTEASNIGMFEVR